MKLLEKITSLFVDDEPEEEEIELEEETKEEYKEPPKNELPKIMRESISKELPPKKDFIEFDFNKEETEVKVEEKTAEIPEPVAPTKKFNFPIDFDEEVKRAEKREEIPQRRANANAESIAKKNSVNHNVNVLNMNYETPKKSAELYPRKESNIKPKFKASPVISPVYGILDKNYTKEEVKEKNDDTLSIKRASKKVDFETVRKKAFGNLVDEIKDSMLCENCELYKEVQKISNLKEDDLLYDMTVEPEKEVTIENAYDNYEEFGVAYEPVKEKKKVEPEPELEPEPIEEIIEIKEEIIPPVVKKEQPKVIENIIINNNVNTNSSDDEEEEKVPYQKLTNKVEDDDIDIEPKKEKVPSREKNKKETKEEKVDDDFFELIDSMYKERIDE